MADESFADLFAQTDAKRPKPPRPGEKVSGKITRVGKKHAIVDLGGGTDGMLDLVDFTDGEARPQVGDRFDGVVLSIEHRVVNVGRRLGKGEQGVHGLEQALKTQLPIEGVVSAVNKGGYVIDAAGVRCFCPLGQMSLKRIEDPSTLIGQRLTFLVSELKDRDAVLTRKPLLEAAQREQRKHTVATLAVGARLKGVVSSVRDFGAFVDLGGIDGLIPVSELAWNRVQAQEVVSPGQLVEVEVLKVEGARDAARPNEWQGGAPERITLSLRALTERPEPKGSAKASVRSEIAKPQVGVVVEAVVDKVESFGLFVTFPGGRGLLPSSELPDSERGNDLRKKYPVGTVLKAAIVEIRSDGKIRLSKRAAESSAERADADAFLQQQTQSQSFGTLATKLNRALKRQ